VIADYHMHRDEREEIAHDASSVGPFVAAARVAGVDEIGFAEHVYYFRQTRPLWTVPYHVERCNYDLDTYVEAVTGAKEQGWPVKLGLEVDYAPVAEAIARSGVAIEVSTSGLRKPVGELYPDPRFLVECRNREVPVTLASDAHVPALVRRDFDRARQLLRSAGYETITIFERREPRQVPFDG
jgi:hypothetical protein